MLSDEKSGYFNLKFNFYINHISFDLIFILRKVLIVAEIFVGHAFA